uniref:Zgc:110741 [Danio rerio] n=2 Tax=Lepeophtheirus salmonis TaxID=72036 RepID=A0A0K2UCQ8_LEPSM
MPSRFDVVYRSVLLSKFFVNGWGRPEDLRKIIELRRGCLPRVNHLDYPVDIHKEDSSHNDLRIVEGSFTSPFNDVAPELLPDPVQKCHFQAILPKSKAKEGGTPLVVQYAGTGDHYFWRRRHLMAFPLLRERGVASILIENPFYGLRKPPEQRRSTLRNVTDLLVMGACLIMESSVIYSLAQESWGYWPIVSHGISMGGHMAALGAVNWNKPIGLVPCMTSCSASWTFTSGVLTESLPWDLLEEQYHNEVRYHDEIRKMIYPNEEALKKVISQYPPYTPEKKWSHLLNLSQSKLSSDKKFHAVEFMRGILDECTHFRNYSYPIDPSLIIIVASDIDAYQPKDGAQFFQEIWPGVEIRYIKGQGHVQSYLFQQSNFRKAIYDVIDKMVGKYSESNLSELKSQKQ